MTIIVYSPKNKKAYINMLKNGVRVINPLNIKNKIALITRDFDWLPSKTRAHRHNGFMP